ncbi:GNAT family N-acetyltransferase [Futiania mangrovi]|uniref:GNAT family N-acetyltransferase n=1 Tax=Futiania mangrovi TaxID=2959716 RepID=A0A9J6PFY8_9PROT|nr:GNAT family N-acetyltransferase [Futiania mangrovii]MCP1337390.1 GNAT family N-acetyltransferase [Futiania mangrovii]
MSLRVEPLTGADLTAALPALARLRIEVFRDFPYLYEGTLDYEAGYVARFAAADGAVIVGAFDGDRIVGVATGAPMAGQLDAFVQPFRERGHDIEGIFYFGESVLLPAYRGRGIGHAFFDRREAHARTLGCSVATFCAVVRPDDHPMRPADYTPLDAFWRKRGYAPVAGLAGQFGWRDVGDAEETQKPMQFWMRTL